jgi:hypothetical protein
MTTKTEASEFELSDRSNFQVPDEKLELVRRSERLREAVNAAGGPLAVAKSSGIPISTLQGYLRGGDMKVSNLAALATACSVNIAWLVAGHRPKADLQHASVASVALAETKPAVSRPFKAFATIKVDQLAEAYVEAKVKFAEGDGDPTPRELMQVTLLIYDQINKP